MKPNRNVHQPPAQKPKPMRVTYENPVNQEIWICENVHDTETIDDVVYIRVHKPDGMRTNLMRRDALRVIKLK